MSEQGNLPTQSEEVMVDGTFKITSGDDGGVYLTVSPARGGGAPVREPAVIAELKSRDIKDFNMNLLMSTVKEAAGTAVKVADAAPERAEPEIQVLVERDRMEASLQVVMAQNSRPVQLEEALEKIHAAGVVNGVDRNEVQKAVERPGSRAVIAKGSVPVNGTDARIEFHVDTERKGRPLELEDGRVDFKDLNLFTVVAEGDLLAEKIPATTGTPGTDVLGQPVFAKAGRDLPIPAGKNVRVEDNKIYAGISGQLQVISNKIHVSPVIEIKGDVDLSTGNIEFVGNVVVRGSVQSGFTVKADGNVEIYGSVSGGIVEGRNVVVRMGIQGMHRGYIKAKEHVTTKFIENATVSADGDVMVNDVVLHSNVSAGRKVIVEGRRGFVAGGHIIAGEEIRAKVVGTHLAVSTELEVGVNPGLRAEYQELRKELKQSEAKLDQAQKALNVLRNYNTELSPEKREVMLKMTKTQFNLTGQVDTMRKRVAEIELIFEEMRYGRIRVQDIVYPGVKLVIGTLVRPIRESSKFVSFYADEGEIKTGSFR